MLGASCLRLGTNGGSGKASVEWLDSGVSMALEKPGTIVATSAPMVANRLAWIQ